MGTSARDAGDWPSDPRLTGRFVRTVERPGTPAIHLVGVVHDHPASVHRVRTVVEETAPAVVALEVAPVALPLFEQYATDERRPPRNGGELSAAIQAAEDVRVVGIDAPNPRFLASLTRRCLDERVSLQTARRLLGGVADVTKEAAMCRLAATLDARTPLSVTMGSDDRHDRSGQNDPARQAAAERQIVDRIDGVLTALDRPPAVRLRDATREACMVRRLAGFEADGPVVAVLGNGHLDAVASGLRAAD